MASKAKLDDVDLISTLRGLIQDCESSNTERSGERRRALDYYNGIMSDVPADDGRSSIVSRDVRATIKKVMPAIRRVLLGSDTIVEYLPVSQQDEGIAPQATQYINSVTVKESDCKTAIADAIQSALLLKEGILTWWNEKKRRITVTFHSGLTQEEIAQLKSDKSVDILHVSEPSQAQMPDGTEIQVFSVRVKREITENCNRVMAVPIEDFGIHPDAMTVNDAAIMYHKFRMRRSDLVSMGYDKDIVDGLSPEQFSEFDDPAHLPREINEVTRNGRFNSRDPAMEFITVYRCFVRTDFDQDGIAELREVHYVDTGDQQVLFNDYADEPRFAIIVAERVPHSTRGVSIFEDVEELQRLKTVLSRQALDNTYQHNNPQPAYQDGAIINSSAVSSPQYGEPVKVAAGYDVQAALQWRITPFVADKTAMMIDRVDADIASRTGITSGSAMLNPDALQDVREQGVQMISDQASAQAWCMITDLSEGLKPLFRGLLKLVIQFQDKPKSFRVNNQWMEYDPRSWNADMDCSVNIGLGTGTKERDMQALQIIAQGQEKILTGFGPNNAMVTSDNLYNLADQMTRAAGLKDVDKFFTKPQPGQPLTPPQQGPSPEQQKMQMQMQMDQQKMQAEHTREQDRMQVDLQVKAAEAQKNMQMAQVEAANKQADRDQQMQLAREKMANENQLAREKMQQDLLIANMKASGQMLDPVTGALKPTTVDERLDQHGHLLAAIHQAISQPKHIALVKDETGRTSGAIVQPMQPQQQIMQPQQKMVN